jgi:hypothetical protein
MCFILTNCYGIIEEYKKFYESWLEITKTQMDKINEEKQAQEDKNKI